MIGWYLIAGMITVSLTACISACKKDELVKQDFKQPRIGNLGGMKVSIPWYMAELIEYEGDPGWDAEKWKTFKSPQRTFDSKITSFGFEVRYPDMQTKESNEGFQDWRQQSSHPSDSMWLGVSIQSGERYGGNGRLDYLIKRTQTPNEKYEWFNYEKLSDRPYGLTHYAVKGINPKTGTAYRDDSNDIYFYKKNNKTITYIECSNVVIAAAPCMQYFDLEEQGYQIQGSISYRRGLLKDWLSIQTKVKTQILNFKFQ